jgi:predicted unusual protein kinase regulating ubiquinone biosynthesis (AarF/ABC1/UbiB family)
MGVTRRWIDTLLAVHGHEVFLTDRFNADPHPGNIVVMGDGRLGLIDCGYCSHRPLRTA